MTCPVCLYTGTDGERRCRACGFALEGDLVLGAATEHDHRAAAAELATAAHAWDLAAARRALPPDADRAEAERWAGLLRGPGPDGRAGELRPRHPEGQGPQRPDGQGSQRPDGQDELAAARGLDEVLRGLVHGELPDVLFVAFGTEQALAVRAFADAAGVPVARVHAAVRWDELDKALGGAARLRRFRLAGGVGADADAPPVDRPRFGDAVRQWVREVLPGGAGAVVLLGGGAGWTLLDEAAEAVRATGAVRAETAGDGAPGPGPGTGTEDAVVRRVRQLLRGAPLREPYTLLLARPGTGTGAYAGTEAYVPLELEHRVLFEAGTRLAPGETRSTTVTVHGGPPVARAGDGAAAVPDEQLAVALPLFAGYYRPDGALPRVLEVARARVPALGSARLTFVLRGPGEVALRDGDGGAGPMTAHDREPAGADAEEPVAALHAVLRRMPGRIRRPVPLELICAVELSGADPGEVAERVQFADELIRAAEAQGGAPGAARVGLVGYYRHAPRNAHQPSRKLILSVPPGPAADARRHLRELPVEVLDRDTLTASLEDALKAAARMTRTGTAAGRTAGGVRRVLLVVGHRPPALPAQRGLVPGCPRGVDWREQLGTLRGRGVRVGIRAAPFAEPGTATEGGAAAGAGAGPGPAAAGGGVPARARLHRYLAQSWRELAHADGLCFRPGSDPPHRVALALAAERPRDTDSSPLALAAPLLPPRPTEPPRS